MKVPWRYLLPALALLGLLTAAVINPAWTIDYVVRPVTRILWLGLRLLMIVDQEIYWTLLIFAAFTLLVRLVPVRAAPSIRPPGYTGSVQPDDRVAHWQALIRAAATDPAARSTLQQSLRDLDASLSPDDEAGAEVLSLPAYRPNLLGVLRAKIRHPFLRRLLPRPARDIEYEHSLARILTKLETRMEGSTHDPSPASDDH